LYIFTAVCASALIAPAVATATPQQAATRTVITVTTNPYQQSARAWPRCTHASTTISRENQLGETVVSITNTTEYCYGRKGVLQLVSGVDPPKTTTNFGWHVTGSSRKWTSRWLNSGHTLVRTRAKAHFFMSVLGVVTQSWNGDVCLTISGITGKAKGC
jgi:hypothetical protein